MTQRLCLAFILASLAFQAHASLIAVSLPRFNDNFINLLRMNIESTIDKSGNDVYIDQAEDSKEKQFAQVKHFTDEKVDALIVILVNPSKDFAQSIVDLATKNNIPLVFVNVQPDISPLPNGVVYVGSNELESGTLEMEELARLANYKGNVALLMGEESHPAAKIRTLDVDTVIKKYPDMKVIVRARGNWERNEGLKLTSKWLKEYAGQFNIIAANNDEMAIGAIAAIEEAGQNPRDYLIGGVDATADALKYMADGKLDVTVFQDVAGQAQGAANAALDMANGKTVSKEIWVPFKLVNKDNLNQFTNNH